MKPAKRRHLQPVTSYCDKHGPYRDQVGSPIGCPVCAQEQEEEGHQIWLTTSPMLNEDTSK